MSASFSFDVNGRIFMFDAGGTAANGDRIKQISDQVDAHPNWSDEQIADALKSAGARFGPQKKDQFIRSLPMETLKYLLGNFKIASVKFVPREETDAEEHQSLALLAWEAILVVNEKGTGNFKYIALFEPFDGRLIHLMRLPSAQQK